LHLCENDQGYDAKAKSQLRNRVNAELKKRFSPEKGGDWTDLLIAPLVSAIGFSLAWVFLFFKTGDTLSFLRLVGGLFFGIGWGVFSLVFFFGKLGQRIVDLVRGS
jgi:hypothetical protein